MTILVFTPEAYVTPHCVSSAITARGLQDLGHSVAMVSCHGQFRRCVAKASLSHLPTNEEAAAICASCQANFLRIVDEFQLPYIDLPAGLNGELATELRARILEAGHNLINFEYDGIPFGRLCAGDLILTKKVLDTSLLDDDSMVWYRENVETAVLSYIAVSQILAEGTFSHLLFFNAYAPNLAAAKAAEQAGVAVRNLSVASHKSSDCRNIMVMRGEGRVHFHDMLEHWTVWRDCAASPDMIRESSEDLLFRFMGRGAFAYSPQKTRTPGDQRNALGIDGSRKLIVACTSSMDEMLSADQIMRGMGRSFPQEPELFADQREWLAFLVDLVSGRDDLQLIVRIHPREDRNKRDSVRSAHLDVLEELFDKKPNNVAVVWPRDPVSSYDLMECADLILTAWSSTGLEAARLGIPVLGAFRNHVGYKLGDFIHGAETRDEYHAKIFELLEAPPQIASMLMAYRWYSYSRFSACVNIEPCIRSPDFHGIPKYVTPHTGDHLAHIVLSEHPIRTNWDSLLPERQSSLAYREEMERIRQEILRIIDFLFTDDLKPSRTTLIIQNSPPTGSQAGTPVLELLGDGFCRYHADGTVAERYSPMVCRLARLATIATALSARIESGETPTRKLAAGGVKA